jgi:hypothetical protein
LENEMSVDALKADARRLADHLRTKFGWNLKLSASLEAIAASRGYKDWNTCVAALSQDKSHAPSTVPSMPARVADIAPADLLWHAVEQQVTNIRLYLKPTGTPSLLTLGRPGGRPIQETLDLPTALRLMEGFIQKPPLLHKASADSGNYHLQRDGEYLSVRWATMGGRDDSAELVMRLHPPLSKIRSLSVPPTDWVEQALTGTPGLYLVAGTTGAGKTTTIRHVAEEAGRRHLPFVQILLEDEILPAGSLPAYAPRGLSDLRGILAYVSQGGAKGVIVTEPIRCEEHADILLEHVAKGMTVVTEIHASGAQGAIRHLGDMSSGKYDFRQLLRGVQAQTFLNKACPTCSGNRCKACQSLGVDGRYLVTEVALFSRKHSVKSAEEGAEWWPTLIDGAVDACKKGMVTSSEVLRRFGNEPAILAALGLSLDSPFSSRN